MPVGVQSTQRSAESGKPETPQSTSDAQARIRVNSDLVVLSVTVKDRNGNLVPGLQQKDFQVLDDGVEQSIDVFTAEGLPLSIVILVDDDLKSGDAAEMAPTLQAILGGISASDEAMASRFDLLFYPGGGFTSDQGQLVAQLKEMQAHSGPSTARPVPWVTSPSAHPHGIGEPVPDVPTRLGSRPTKALDDAVYAAAQLLAARDVSRRKVILLISDGINGPIFNHHSYSSTMELLLHSNASVFSLAVGSDRPQRRFSRLAGYANGSGGDVFYAAKSSAMEQLYSRITEQARHEYTIAYAPRGNDRSSNYHRIELRTARTGLFPRTRDGYYTEAATGTPRR
ncbi:MAG TPA: VWA domain-containing protein [Candidatus Acidoferrales bacterium]|nr:VWA domain-containing protein [Candidatus Acidoferrales bacterium]